MAGDLDLLEGDWTVRVKDWVWVYSFAKGGRVTWRDSGSGSGAGTWSSNAKAVNIAWPSGVRESWSRPLTASSKRTWYASSYFTGAYQIEKAGGAAAPAPAGPVALAKPPDVRQRALYCWAAGASSWLSAKGRPKKSVDDLIGAYGGYLNRDGSLPEGDSDDPDALKGGLKTVFGKIGIQVQTVQTKDITADFVARKLKAQGHFLLMAQHGGDMGHTYVVYGVGDPSMEYFSVFDPLIGYSVKKFSDLHGSSAYVGAAN